MGLINNNEVSSSFSVTELHPFIAKPSISSTITNFSTAQASLPNSTPIDHDTSAFSFQHHLSEAADGNKRQLCAGRWNPTPEQLEVMEDLYQRGTHTPTTEQIQTITAQLRQFGKVEGKNVFYWFQNHKARERQKRRRQLEAAASLSEYNLDGSTRKDSGSNWKGFQVEGCKSGQTPANSNRTEQESASAFAAESTSNVECLHYCHPQLQLQHDHATCHHLTTTALAANSINCDCYHPLVFHHQSPLVLTGTSTNALLSKSTPRINFIDQSLITSTGAVSIGAHEKDDQYCIGQNSESHETLDLFPVNGSRSLLEEKAEAQAESRAHEMITLSSELTLTPCYFFEFL